MQNQSCKIIAICGGSGSGKTTLAKKITKLFGIEKCKIISQDNYYFDLSKKFDFDGGSINFDHPDSIEFNLLSKHLQLLKKNKIINVPCYDFKTHSRMANTKNIIPSELIIVDGTLILDSPILNPVFDLKIFLDISNETRLKRRIKRDINERNRTKEGIINQWNKQVLPMHNKFVQKSLTLADIIISEQKDLDIAANEIYRKISKIK